MYCERGHVRQNTTIRKLRKFILRLYLCTYNNKTYYILIEMFKNVCNISV
ncbi:hypothetical protein PGB90_000993 [Kerria lacca]